LLHTVITGLTMMLTRRGVLVEDMGQTWLTEPDADGEQAHTLRPLQAAAITHRIAFVSHGATSPLAGRLLFSLAKPVSAEPIALRGRGARRLRMAPKMGDTTVDEGHCEKQPTQVPGASGLC